jgi:hypothetical protein
MEWLKVWALSSNPSTAKNKRKNPKQQQNRTQTHRLLVARAVLLSSVE